MFLKVAPLDVISALYTVLISPKVRVVVSNIVIFRDVHGSDRIGSDRTLVGSDKNYRLSENPTIRSEVSNSRLNNIHIADMLLTDKSEVKLTIIY